ncbi:hypothetical protein [Dokdonella sp.]|uniref:hypothetical protein n=1 Tax=Dokdonella sp. TaxID=2291710 RepID=UPI003529D0D4
MYFQIGNPKPLSSLRPSLENLMQLKRNYQIAVIDDEPFAKSDSLRAHKFSIVELGDIRAVDQVAEYPIVVCDIRGVGGALHSELEGAHLVAEIRKSYPDKFLVSYSGAQYDIRYNEALRSVDASLPKDASTNEWVRTIESGLLKVGSPKERWLRLRRTLLERGVEIHEVFELEQRFIRAVQKRDATKLKVGGIPEEAKELVVTFAKIALVQIIKGLA